MKRTSITLALLLCTTSLLSADGEDTDKTLVAWVSPANLSQQGGSALTIQSGDRFDAIVLGERARARWMAGSNYFRRTQPNQDHYPAETAHAGTMVQIAIVYDGEDIRIYRNGEPYAAYRTKNIDLLGIDNHIAVFGLRHVGAGTGTPLAGAIDDARIYARALTQAEIASLKPNEKSTVAPLAWWDFEGDKVTDRAGRFGHSAMTDGVKLADGRLVLDGTGYLVAARTQVDAKMATRQPNPRAPGPPYVPETPAWPEDPPADWLTFHLAHQHIRENPNIRLFAKGGDAAVKSIKAWEMKTIYRCIRRGSPSGASHVDQKQRGAAGAGKNATASRTAKKGQKRVLPPSMGRPRSSVVGETLTVGQDARVWLAHVFVLCRL